MLAEQMDVRIEVEDSHVLLVFPKMLDDFLTPWQAAQQLGATLEMAAHDIPNPGIPVASQVQMESDQVRLSSHKDLVALLFQHTDRIRLCKDAAVLVARAIRKKAQDVQLASRGVHLVYNKKGQLQSVHNLKHGTVQVIPGR